MKNLKQTQLWTKPEAKTLEVKQLDTKKLSVESALYASGAHKGQLTIGGR